MKVFNAAKNSLIGDFLGIGIAGALFNAPYKISAKEELVLVVACILGALINLKREMDIIFIVILYNVSLYILNEEIKSDNIVFDIIVLIIIFNILESKINDELLISMIITIYYIYKEEKKDELHKE